MAEKRKTIGEIVRFGIVGVGATALHYLIYYALMQIVPVNIAYAIGYILSFLANFYATSYFTFHSTPTWGKLVGMAGAHGINFLLHMVLLNVFLFLGVPEVWAPLPVFALVIPINFLLVRFVFKRH